jgi:hypothetical protein
LPAKGFPATAGFTASWKWRSSDGCDGEFVARGVVDAGPPAERPWGPGEMVVTIEVRRSAFGMDDHDER